MWSAGTKNRRFIMEKRQFQYEYLGHSDGLKFTIDNEGSYLTILLDRPTMEEIEAITSFVEMQMTCFPNCLWFTFRFGNLDWMEAPFNPYFCADNADDLIADLKKACAKIKITLLDTSTAEVCFEGNAEIPEPFQSGMAVGCEMLLMQEPDKDGYYSFIDQLQNTYDTAELAKTALLKCEVKYSQRVFAPKSEKTYRVVANILDPMCGQTVEEMLLGVPREHGVYRKETLEVDGKQYEHYQSKMDKETGEVYLLVAYKSGKAEWFVCSKKMWLEAYRQMK